MKKLLAVAALFALTLANGPGAGADAVTTTSEPTTSELRNVLEEQLDGGSGEASILQSSSATSFAAEDPDLIVAPVQTRWRINTYKLNYSFEECATYEVNATFAVTADGPNQLEGPYFLFGLVNSNDEFLAGEGVNGPTEIDGTSTGNLSESVDGSDVTGGAGIVYLAPTAIDAEDYSGSFGTTFGAPTVGVVADRTDCLHETTTTTATTSPKPAKSASSPAIRSNTATPTAGGSLTLTGSGYKPFTEVQITIGNIVVRTVTTDAAGNFSSDIQVPASLDGQQSVTALGTSPDGTPNVEVLGIRISPVTASGTVPQSLAATGTGLQLGLVGATLSALGLALLALGHRTRPKK